MTELAREILLCFSKWGERERRGGLEKVAEIAIYNEKLNPPIIPKLPL